MKRLYLTFLLYMVMTNAEGFPCPPDLSPILKSAKGTFALRHSLLEAKSGEDITFYFKPCNDPLCIEQIKFEKVLVSADMPEHGHGLAVRPEIFIDLPCSKVSGLYFHMPGRWRIMVDVHRKSEVERIQINAEIE